jgi:hypothetical protein
MVPRTGMPEHAGRTEKSTKQRAGKTRWRFLGVTKKIFPLKTDPNQYAFAICDLRAAALNNDTEA